MRMQTGWFLAVLVLAGLLGGCSMVGGSEEGRIAGLETQVSQQEAYIEYQSTQIANNQAVISYLATQIPRAFVETGPVTPTPFVEDGISGSVQVHGGGCCVGSTAGQVIPVDVQFEAVSANGAVTEMRVIVSRAKVELSDFEDVVWEAFVPEKEFQIDVPVNWSTFWVYVQYRDASGLVSEVYSDDIAVEGMPPQPSSTPNG